MTDLEKKLDALPDCVIEATAEAIGGAMDCLRVWSAWGVSTMGAADFAPVADDGERVAEIARAAITAYLKFSADAAPQPAPAVPEAIDLLRTMEWLYKPYDDYSHAQAGYYCPECEEMRESGHRDDCKLRAMLAAAPPATVKDSLIVQQATAVPDALRGVNEAKEKLGLPESSGRWVKKVMEDGR